MANKFDCFVADRNNGKHNLGDDELKVALTNITPLSSFTRFSDVTEISPGGGYDAGGKAIAITSSSQTLGSYSLVPAGDLTWFSTGAFSTFRYAVLYNNTHPDKPLISWYDYGQSVSMVNQDKLVFDVASTLMTGI
jgi:hypothetical protein